MLYLIYAEDSPSTLVQRIINRDAHLERLEALKQQQRLILAGPHPNIDSNRPDESGFSGSTIIAEFENLSAAKAWAEADPYYLNGVYQKITVKPFYRAF